MGCIRVYLQKMRHRMKLDLLRELGRQYPVFCFLLLVLLLSTVLLNRYLHIIMVFWSFLAGVVTFYCSLGPETLLPNILLSIKPKTKDQQELFPLGHSCAVCGKIKCKRHRPTLLLENYQPWLDLKVPSKVDASLSEVLELVLENFVYPWYRDITDDEAFVDELRVTLRFFAAVLVRRTQKVDIPGLITAKLLKVSMKHIEIITKARQKVKNAEYLQQAALEEYGPDLHVALRSRRDELLYLRKLTEMLFPYILPPKASDCRSLTLLIREVLAGSVFLPALDYLADPDTVNHLLLIFIDNSPPEAAMEPSSTLVPFLHKYSDVRNKKPSVLKLELKEIREQQDLLFRFMNFLKQEGAVHVLQFCLTVEEFNDKILCPELSDSEMLMLHEEVKKIYETYCLDESIDKIRFDPFIVEEIKNIAEGPYAGVVKLQTMRCLFEAYEHYFRQLLRGAESPARNSKLSRNSLSLDDIRSWEWDYAQSPESPSSTPGSSSPASVNHHLHVQSIVALPSGSYGCLTSRPGSLKNTSKRGESFGISRIGSKIKGVFKSTTMEGAMLPSYGLVEGEDDVVEEAMMVLEDDSPMEAVSTPSTPRNLSAWTITIPYIDFYDDDIKRERIPVFCIDVERNDRKAEDIWNFMSSNQNSLSFMKLLQHPELSNSQLLADFLSPHRKIIKSVPSKLIKELFNELFKNNANRSESTEKKHNQNYFMEMITVEGVYDYLMFVGRVVFRIPDWLHHLLMGGRILLKNTLEAYTDHYLQHKLDKVFQEHRLVSLITLLRDAVFCENSEPRSLADKQKRAKKTFEEMRKYIPEFLGKCIGEEARYEGVRLLFDGLQQPVLNKQLTYVLLDLALLELFPELNKQPGQKETPNMAPWMIYVKECELEGAAVTCMGEKEEEIPELSQCPIDYPAESRVMTNPSRFVHGDESRSLSQRQIDICLQELSDTSKVQTLAGLPTFDVIED
ncbi:unnamed protein product [Coregonus sp. 'balchen']|nr:unnamed protein product [Coregonus sp. 'balchen']